MSSPAAPPGPPCPVCLCEETDCLEGVSSASHVDYYRCRNCGHVWNLPRAIMEPPCDPAV